MELQGSRTERNLWAAFNAESAARTKYEQYARALRAAGEEALARLFEETAQNEMAHAGLWFARLAPQTRPDAALSQAAAGEHEEWTRMYAEFERVAREEGFDALAEQFHLAAGVEKGHEQRFRSAAAAQAPAQGAATWRCGNCGYTAVGAAAPQKCPLCGAPAGWFERATDTPLADK